MIRKPTLLTEYQRKCWYFYQDIFPKSSKTSELRIQELQRVTTLEGKKEKKEKIKFISFMWVEFSSSAMTFVWK